MSQPTKYTSKMMNSIWGMYNKYSVHNLKAVQGDALAATASFTQQAQDQHFRASDAR